jgi:hypothetical protein
MDKVKKKIALQKNFLNKPNNLQKNGGVVSDLRKDKNFKAIYTKKHDGMNR